MHSINMLQNLLYTDNAQQSNACVMSNTLRNIATSIYIAKVAMHIALLQPGRDTKAEDKRCVHIILTDNHMQHFFRRCILLLC
jgi:hypothetical protein